jgi:2-dehydropantoate 2-reductase
MTEVRQTIAIVGLGAIGGILAGCLRAADRHDVIACVRAPLDRIVVERPEDRVDLPLEALADPDDAKPVDWVLLCTKAQQSASTAAWLARLCGPNTRVATMQNGMGHALRLAPFVGDARVVPAIVYFNGERFGPGHMRFRRAGDYELALGDDADSRDLHALLAGTPMRILVSPDFHTLAWRKLLINAVANPVTALTVERQAVFRRPDIADLCLAVLDEAVAVGRADGAAFAPDEAARTMATLLTYPPEAGTSMYFDRLAGKALEVEAITGFIVAAGERLGVPTPLNRAMLALLRAVSDASAPA